MPLDPLASIEDLQGRLGRDLTGADLARAELLLADASAAVRSHTGQEISSRSSTARLQVRDGRVRLPQRPVTDVTAVDNVDGVAQIFTWYGGDVLELNGGYGLVNGPWPWGNYGTVWLDVTYDHGYEEIPGEIVAIVCQIAARAFGTTPDDSGYTQEGIGNYSYQVGAAAAAGAVGLLADERRILDRYRRVGGQTWVGRRWVGLR